MRCLECMHTTFVATEKLIRDVYFDRRGDPVEHKNEETQEILGPYVCTRCGWEIDSVRWDRWRDYGYPFEVVGWEDLSEEKKEAHAKSIYAVLANLCGAPGALKVSFIEQMKVCRVPFEFRFAGTLGWGGKFYLTNHEWRVGYYVEDRTDSRDANTKRANLELASRYDILQIKAYQDRKEQASGDDKA